MFMKEFGKKKKKKKKFAIYMYTCIVCCLISMVIVMRHKCLFVRRMKGLGTSPCFPTIFFSKGNNFYDFLTAKSKDKKRLFNVRERSD